MRFCISAKFRERHTAPPVLLLEATNAENNLLSLYPYCTIKPSFVSANEHIFTVEHKFCPTIDKQKTIGYVISVMRNRHRGEVRRYDRDGSQRSLHTCRPRCS